MELLRPAAILVALTACDPLLDGVADPRPEPVRRSSRYADCLESVAASSEVACLVLDDFRSLVLLGPDGEASCDLDLTLAREARARMAWIEDRVYLCSRDGLERLDLRSGEVETVGPRCQGVMELDGEALVFEDAARIAPLEEASASAPGAVELAASPWPGLSTGWAGTVEFAVQPRTGELYALDLASGETRQRSLPGTISMAGGLERIGPRSLLALEHVGPGEARWLALEDGEALTVTPTPSRSRLFEPLLVDCRGPAG